MRPQRLPQFFYCFRGEIPQSRRFHMHSLPRESDAAAIS
jgi:hypothetical protein